MKGHELPGPNQRKKSPAKMTRYGAGLQGLGMTVAMPLLMMDGMKMQMMPKGNQEVDPEEEDKKRKREVSMRKKGSPAKAKKSLEEKLYGPEPTNALDAGKKFWKKSLLTMGALAALGSVKGPKTASQKAYEQATNNPQ